MQHTHRPKHSSHADELFEYRSVERKRLKIAITITAIVMLAEIIGGVLTGSMALISDAGHMFTHSFALIISLGAIICANRASCHHRTFGYYRVEILAALLNSLFLFGLTAWILIESVRRMIRPVSIMGLQMFIVAIIGLIANLANVWLLHDASRDDLNIKAAFFHMLSDTISSLVIILGAIVIHFTGWNIIDSIVSIGIASVIAVWGWGLFKDSVNILLETAPKGMNSDIISKDLKENIKEIRGISDIHIWEITSKMYAMTAHIRIANMSIEKSREILDKINKLLDEKYDIEHTTIQFELFEEN